MMHNNLIDNSSDALSMQQYLKRCILAEGVDKIQIATGYWDIPGMTLVLNELKSFLEREETSFELLIGKDPYVYTSMIKNPKYKDATYPYDFIRTDIHDLEIKEEYEDVIKLLLKYGGSSKIQIRIYTKNSKEEDEFLHSKCYIFSGSSHSFGIVGSSNFTKKGLLGNAELNYLETDPARITARPTHGSNAKGHICWFEEKWKLSKEWTQEFLEQIIKKSPIYIDIQKNTAQEFTPYEQYIKLLQLQFGDVVDKNLGQEIEGYLPAKVHKLDYQIEAVKRCISIMHEHGGFMLADVVGLGKTIIGTLIIKRFLSVPENDGRERKVLIITPPAIQSGWKKTIAMFDKDSDEKIAPYIDFITTGRIANITEEDDWEENDDDSADSGEFVGTLQDKNYGFIVIDESHKFRNSTTFMYRSLDELIIKIGSNTGVYPYIGLLSATPQNNRPNDLKNQIYLFERNRNDSTLKKAESGNIEKFFADVNREYDLLINNRSNITEEERKQRLEAVSKKLRDCVLSDILERRTRTDVEKYYKEDIESQGLVFPKIVGPNTLKYIMDDELAQLFSDTMTIIAPNQNERLLTNEWLKYSRYRAIEYFVDPANEQKHTGRGNRGVNDVARQMATIMQILLVKRLESSFTAFTQSLFNLRRYTENMIRMWENNTIFVCPQINVNQELDYEAKTKKRGGKVSFNDCVEEIRVKIQKLTNQGRNERGQNAEYKRNDFKEEYYSQLKEDYNLISNLCDRWAKNSQDPKFDAFKENIKPELFNPEKNTSGKLVIFSEAIDTVQALARAVKAKGYKPLVITAANRDEMEKTIEENFDANYEGQWKDEYNVIITTEVLAEGVNLHRANVILNYDTPWNSTRLMQRIGRVNRIGSKEPFVYVYNFMPSAEGDAQIELVRKAHTKLQSFHILFGEDSKIFSDEESVVHYDMIKAIEGEESPMQQYVYELKQYKETHTERYKQIEQTNEGWEMAQATNGTAYFIVKAPRSAKLAISIHTTKDSQSKAQIISLLELLEAMRVDESAQRIALPDNWQQLSADAIKTYNQYFVHINKSRAGDKRTQALQIIVKLYNNDTISEKSKELLKNTRKLVDKGSLDIIKKILAIGQVLEEKKPSLFTIKQQDIDEILEREIGKLVTNVESKQGEASIILATIK
ncbi:DEAD/DEAH box helicase family protein [Capnocytophaga genosp. AHN8471]|uniref:DEAD/DEAH box helicase family protein n=1 Tax=Capnocytophaga genosp. AHN8471 TaxID=327574 RepID=A0ABS1YYK3_9FLAO|nr:helicase-related protein [Capnocytophaga genosp. AHN8471]MBM0651505.1 DEAD/DEAH box helicase family protein [Capnocytophaga genosp. AHN8471]MBM0663375.1 DEAD/DEAH box helicase family protein [Capnocytophaga genosp. AHN8471]